MSGWRRAVWFFALLLALAAGCSAGSGSRPPVAPSPRVGQSLDLGSISTAAPPATAETTAAFGVLAAALQSLVASPQAPAQALNRELLVASSTLDVLRLSAGAGVAPEQARRWLPELGWNWLVTQTAIDSPDGAYREWRVLIAGFAVGDGAEGFVQNPFLLPAPLLHGARQAAPADFAPPATLTQSPDTIVPLIAPDTPLAGRRGALVWRRGRIVVMVTEAVTAPTLDPTPLIALARELDQRLVQIPGSVGR